MKKSSVCPIQIPCPLKIFIKEQSLTFDENGMPSETYASIIRRAIELLANSKKNKVNVNRL